jgi:hypothetical protein
VEVILICLQKFAGTYRHILTGQVILMSGILIERFYCRLKNRSESDELEARVHESHSQIFDSFDSRFIQKIQKIQKIRVQITPLVAVRFIHLVETSTVRQKK